MRVVGFPVVVSGSSFDHSLLCTTLLVYMYNVCISYILGIFYCCGGVHEVREDRVWWDPGSMPQ